MGVTAWLFKGKYDEIKDKAKQHSDRILELEKANNQTQLQLQSLEDKQDHTSEMVKEVKIKTENINEKVNKMDRTLVRISERLGAGDSGENSGIR